MVFRKTLGEIIFKGYILEGKIFAHRAPARSATEDTDDQDIVNYRTKNRTGSFSLDPISLHLPPQGIARDAQRSRRP